MKFYTNQNDFNFLSEGVRCGASQKKGLRDSTEAYSPKVFTFRDVPQIATYHKKLLDFPVVSVLAVFHSDSDGDEFVADFVGESPILIGFCLKTHIEEHGYEW